MKIGDQVKQIMQVRNDMAMLQEDLTSQEKLWKQAEIEMKQENAKIRAEVESLKTQVKVGAAINGELLKVKQALEDEKRRTQDLNNQADMQEEQWQLQLQFLQNRKNNVTALHAEVNATAAAEISKAEAVNLQLQKDGATLKLAIADFKDRIKNDHEKIQFEEQKALAEQAELHRQITAMQEGLKRMDKVKPKAFFDNQEKVLKEGLQKETATILALQSEHQQVVTACNKELQEQDAVKCHENGKLQSRQAEKVQFCNAIQVQNQVLTQDLAKCQAFAGTGEALPQAMPAGLVPPVAMRDEERLLRARVAPAPAPAPYAY